MKYISIFNDQEVVSNYDNCRHIDSKVLDFLVSEIDQIIQQIPGDYHVVLDAGVGNGRILIPFLKNSNFNKTFFIGLDLSSQMLRELSNRPEFGKNKFGLINSDLQKELPIKRRKIDLIYTFATLHILNLWDSAVHNLLNCLLRNRYFILIKEINQFMHQTEGFLGDTELEELEPTLNEFMHLYHDLRKKYYIPFEKSGLCYSDYTLMDKMSTKLGIKKVSAIEDPSLRWEKPHCFSGIISAFRKKHITTWGSDIPNRERVLISDKLSEWLIKRRIDPEKNFYINSRLQIFVYKKL